MTSHIGGADPGRSLVSVVMPVYNAEAYVEEAIRSILDQTHRELEMIVIDDGSTDRSAERIAAIKDSRIRFVDEGVNRGIVRALDHGLALAQGEHIARMDADDRSRPSRLERQLEAFRRTPDLVLCGARIQEFGQSSRRRSLPLSHAEIIATVFLRNPFAHPTVMIKRSALDRLGTAYTEGYEGAEDYELWSRLVFLGPTVNVPATLLDYRVHGRQFSTVENEAVRDGSRRVALALLARIGLTPTSEELGIHQNLSRGLGVPDPAYLRRSAVWAQRFHDAMVEAFPGDAVAVRRVLTASWLRMAANCGLGQRGLRIAFSPAFVRWSGIGIADAAKVFYKAATGYKQHG